MSLEPPLPFRADQPYLGDAIMHGGPPRRSHLVGAPTPPAPATALDLLTRRVQDLDARVRELECRPVWEPWSSRLRRWWHILSARLRTLVREEST